MIATRRWTPALLGGLLLLAAGLATPTAASAADPTLAVAGSAVGPSDSTTDVTVTFRVTVTGGAVGNTSLAITSPASATPRAATVTVDGAKAPTSTVTQAGTLTTVRLGTGASATAGGQLAVGTHSVAYRTAARDVQAGDAASATASGSGALLPITASSGQVAIPTADLAVTVDGDFGESRALRIGNGQSDEFDGELVNRGTALSDATLTVQLPAHLSLDPDFGVELFGEEGDEADVDCSTSGQTVQCDLGPIAPNSEQDLVVNVAAAADAPVGGQEKYSLTATPTSGADSAPADNTLTGTVTYTGRSHLSVTLDAAHPHVAVGSTTTVQVTVRNSGPQAADPALAFLGVIDKLDGAKLGSAHFTVTHFSGARVTDPIGLGGLIGGQSGGSGSSTPTIGPSDAPEPVDPPSANAALSAAAREHPGMLRALATGGRAPASGKHADAAQGSVPVFWQAGRLTPGQSATATLTVKATSLGTTHAFAVGLAPNDAPECLADADSLPSHAQCPEVDSLTLTAVAPTHSGSTNGADPIADTGAPTGQLTLLGLLAVAAGALLIRLTTLARGGRHRA